MDDKKFELKILYCLSCNYKGNFEEVKKYFNSKYQNINVIGEPYPLPKNKQIISYLISGFQFLILTALILINTIKQYLPFIPPKYFEYISKSKLITIALVFFGGNFLNGNIHNTGAFEVYLNKELIWSKIQNGNFPEIEQLIGILKSKSVPLN